MFQTRRTERCTCSRALAPGVAAGTAANVTRDGRDAAGQHRSAWRPRHVVRVRIRKGTRSGSATSSSLSVPVTAFAHSVPCAQTAAQIGSGTSPVGVSADIGGLAPGALYYFRLSPATPAVRVERGHVRDGRRGLRHLELRGLVPEPGRHPDTQAGSHPYEMVTSFAFNTKAAPRIPVCGLAVRVSARGQRQGHHRHAAAGARRQSQRDRKEVHAQRTGTRGSEPGRGREFDTGCPHGSKVGELYLETIGYGTGNYPLYNMVPPHGVAAQFGTRIIFPEAFINAGAAGGRAVPAASGISRYPGDRAALQDQGDGCSGCVGSGANPQAFPDAADRLHGAAAVLDLGRLLPGPRPLRRQERSRRAMPAANWCG